MLKKLKKAMLLVAGISLLAFSVASCNNGSNSVDPEDNPNNQEGTSDPGSNTNPETPPKPELTEVTKTFTQDDFVATKSTIEGGWAYKTYSLAEFVGKKVTINFSCEMKVENTGTSNAWIQWQVNNGGSYPTVVDYTFEPTDTDFITVAGKNAEPIEVANGALFYLSTYQLDTDNLTITVKNIKYTVSYMSEGETKPAIEYPTNIFTVGEAGTCGIKVGDGDLVPFTAALAFDSNTARDIVYNADGSVTWTATAAGGAGGGLALYIKSDKSIINTANYDSVDIELVCSPVTGAWKTGASNPSFALRLLTYDSTGVFGGFVDAEYFGMEEAYGTLNKKVDFNEQKVSEKVIDSADFDEVKAFVLKFNDYNQGLKDGDQLKVQLKKITFNKKEGANADVVTSNALSADKKGKVESINYPTKDWTVLRVQQGEDVKEKEVDIEFAQADLDNAQAAFDNATDDEKEKAEKALDAAKTALENAKTALENAKAAKEEALKKEVKTYEKHAWVYLPAGYDAADKDTKYPVFILLHGYGQNENTWGLSNETEGKIQGYMDRGMADGSVKKFILVVATGVASPEWGPNGGGSDVNGFNAFGGELRNDLLPYIRENYNVAAGRENVALAGLSMGGGQTFSIGIGQCLDEISYFGAFSAATFTGSSDYMKRVEKAFPDLKVKLLYMICGTADSLVINGFNDYVAAAGKWDKIEKFESETVEGGTHDFPVWYKGFKNLIPMLFK